MARLHLWWYFTVAHTHQIFPTSAGYTNGLSYTIRSSEMRVAFKQKHVSRANICTSFTYFQFEKKWAHLHCVRLLTNSTNDFSGAISLVIFSVLSTNIVPSLVHVQIRIISKKLKVKIIQIFQVIFLVPTELFKVIKCPTGAVVDFVELDPFL